MMMAELKHCPFCGGKATLLMRTYALPSQTHLVYCEDCNAEGQPCSTEAEAVEVWNRRSDCPKHGRWVYGESSDAYDVYGVKTWALAGKCSECGFTHKFIEAHVYYAFCPACGAKLEAKDATD